LERKKETTRRAASARAGIDAVTYAFSVRRR
jgi:hypothetical protein